MKFVRVGPRGRELPAVSADGRTAHPLPEDFDVRTTGHREHAAALLASAGAGAGPIDLACVRLGAPFVPGKIVCVGLNYRQHAREAGMAAPGEPILFLKAADTLNGPDDDVLIPPGSVKTDYEVELGVVIAETARQLSDEAPVAPHVLGYVTADDVSERAFQLESGGTWDKGKNCETFGPLGPWLVTCDEVPDPQALRLRSWVNGEPRQDSSTADMIFDVAHLVRYTSRFMTLYPGDVVLTGTPEGVGSGFAPPRFLHPGDVVEVDIEGLGRQRHRFVAASEARA